MAKKIRFPLKMKNGTEVRTLDELKENFDLESVLGYFTDSRLVTWLADRYYDEKAEAVSALSADMPDLNAKLCEILEVEYQAENDDTDVELIARRREKLRILSSVIDDKEIIDNVDLVAVNQDELFDILDEDTDKVYLYGEKFEIPFGKKSVCYIGINNPLVLLGKDKYAYDFKLSGIKFLNVKFEEGRFYPEPVGKFKIEDGILRDGTPDENGQCIIPDGVKIIEYSAFDGCTSLKSITIPDSVTSIRECAFYNCTSLKSITIPDSVTSIGGFAFSGTPLLEAKKKENPLVIVNNILIEGKACSGEVDIPDSVKIIGDDAFKCCTSLKSITIPDSVTSIRECAFDGCTSLKSITIPDSVTSIGGLAFYGCTSLENVIMPDNIELGKNVFLNTPWGKSKGIGQ